MFSSCTVTCWLDKNSLLRPSFASLRWGHALDETIFRPHGKLQVLSESQHQVAHQALMETRTNYWSFATSLWRLCPFKINCTIAWSNFNKAGTTSRSTQGRDGQPLQEMRKVWLMCNALLTKIVTLRLMWLLSKVGFRMGQHMGLWLIILAWVSCLGAGSQKRCGTTSCIKEQNFWLCC